ncbi:surfactin synthase thioesterase subunit [Herbihabitans rhizosphaerae]|uniref:Surfactin synthase thioesterase subunit n=1 Tax=Herbihabitans rhizosphaerae TaxID=1872711 RepID=A0A4V2ES69_9PSEU|nr:alpha/beta fold hydrolase [Herbihabitans rhizosphaerae]RZS36533.1 surfactin synthase thioesterase subunit [Herbihabitans rhizosphaerae]
MTGVAIDSNVWIRRFHPKADAAHRLVCFAHAGGSASYFFPVSRTLPAGVDVLALQYPGRQDRRSERCAEDLYDLVDPIAEALRPWFDRPVTFFGHSMGATLAFEVARRLEEDGVTLAGLFASGRRAPSCHRDEHAHRLADNEFIAEIQSLSGTDSQVLDDEEILRMVLPAIRSDYKAAETYRYRPGPKLRCPITALIGDSDPKATVEEARAWGEHTDGAFELTVFDGGHFYLNNHTSEVLGAITAHAERT